jgi:hypothetical protein
MARPAVTNSFERIAAAFDKAKTTNQERLQALGSADGFLESREGAVYQAKQLEKSVIHYGSVPSYGSEPIVHIPAHLQTASAQHRNGSPRSVAVSGVLGERGMLGMATGQAVQQPRNLEVGSDGSEREKGWVRMASPKSEENANEATEIAVKAVLVATCKAARVTRAPHTCDAVIQSFRVAPQGYSLFKIVAAFPYDENALGGSAYSNSGANSNGRTGDGAISNSGANCLQNKDSLTANGSSTGGYVCCRVERRYSEFHALGQALTRRLPGHSLHVLSYLPPKTMCRNMSLPFLERRRFSLELFLQQLVAEGPEVYQLNVVRRFLGVDLPMPMPLPMAESTAMAVAVPMPIAASVAPSSSSSNSSSSSSSNNNSSNSSNNSNSSNSSSSSNNSLEGSSSEVGPSAHAATPGQLSHRQQQQPGVDI